MARLNIQDEIRRITNETASAAATKALEVSEQAKSKAAEVATLAIAEALKAATLAATKAADAASAAATIAASTGKDLEYIKKDIADTKADVKDIKDRLDNKYVSKEEYQSTQRKIEVNSERINVLEKASYEGTGKSRVIDPQMEALLLEVKNLKESSKEDRGKSLGANSLWSYLLAAIGLIATILAIFSRFQ